MSSVEEEGDEVLKEEVSSFPSEEPLFLVSKGEHVINLLWGRGPVITHEACFYRNVGKRFLSPSRGTVLKWTVGSVWEQLLCLLPRHVL